MQCVGAVGCIAVRRGVVSCDGGKVYGVWGLWWSVVVSGGLWWSVVVMGRSGL